MSNKVDTKAKRDRLSQRREPYWHKLRLGGYIGYRVGANMGSWIARYRNEDGKQNYKSLTLPPHLPQNEYDAATAEATKWFDSIDKGNRAKPGTLQEAADNYVEYLKHEKGERAAKDAKGRVNLHIIPKLQATSLERLTPQLIRKWHQSFLVDGSPETVRKSRATANRNLTTLKAMLNLAHKDGLVQSKAAWDNVTKYKDTHKAREDFLKRDQVEQLIGAAEGNFKILLKAGALTGARYGELAKLKVSDLDKAHDLLNIPKDKTTERKFPLTKQTKAFFVEQAKGKLPEAPMLTKNGIDPWGHSDQTKLMRQAVTKAELPPSVVFYTLRHSFIADLVNEMSVFNIAKITGTSIEMIERHYGKLFQDRVIEVLERTSLVN
ncbi:tyrosine-type recombinase/integrase [Gammaproteobacteria bacterium]|nr:tyrosine-type recombinase/integrase [Gammaproteobacteria bacterium]